MTHSNHFSLEQEFTFQSFALQVQQMSREQAQEFLVSLYRHMMIRDALYNSLLVDAWFGNIPKPPSDRK